MFGIGNREKRSDELYLGSENSFQKAEEERKERESNIKTNIQIQLTNREKIILQEASKKSGLSLSAFIRLTCLRESKRIQKILEEQEEK